MARLAPFSTLRWRVIFTFDSQLLWLFWYSKEASIYQIRKVKLLMLNVQKDSSATYLHSILPARDLFSSYLHIKYDDCQMHNIKPRAMQSFFCWLLQNWFKVSCRRLKLVYWESEKYLGSEYIFPPEESILYKFFKRGKLSFLPLIAVAKAWMFLYSIRFWGLLYLNRFSRKYL